jgi:magnesium transporter
MIRELREVETGVRWLDVGNPSEQELVLLGKEYSLHRTAIEDCLSSIHLPKYERNGNEVFLILRHIDSDKFLEKESDTVNELTRKIAVFWGKNYILTIHRKEQPFLDVVNERWRSLSTGSEDARLALMADILGTAMATYEEPLENSEEIFENLETRVFHRLPEPHLLEELYFLKRKVSIYKKVLRLNLDVIYKVTSGINRQLPFLQDLREETERIYFHADELVDDSSNLLHSHISVSSHRTNEIMRILTVFSVFFMPLTFIVGVFGMNFEHMPELKSPYGYPAVWGIMIVIAAGIFGWFKKKGWLR